MMFNIIHSVARRMRCAVLTTVRGFKKANDAVLVYFG